MIRVYWDSCVFIDRIQRTPGRIALLQQITDLAANGEIEITTSTMAVAEVCKFNEKAAASVSVHEQGAQILAFFQNDYFIVYQVTLGIAESAAELVRNNAGLKPPDAIHIATALLSGAKELHTYDGTGGRDGRLGKLHLRFGDPPLRIVEPSAPAVTPRLFDK